MSEASLLGTQISVCCYVKSMVLQEIVPVPLAQKRLHSDVFFKCQCLIFPSATQYSTQKSTDHVGVLLATDLFLVDSLFFFISKVKY